MKKQQQENQLEKKRMRSDQVTEKLINAVAGHKLKAYLTLISPRKSQSNFKHQLHGFLGCKGGFWVFQGQGFDDPFGSCSQHAKLCFGPNPHTPAHRDPV